MVRWLLQSFVAAACMLTLGACQAEKDTRVVLRVYAASSLTDAFDALEYAFESAHPAVDVRMNFAGSQILKLQIEQGAPADIFASAAADHIDDLMKLGKARKSQVFAYNRLVVIQPRSHAGIGSFWDLPSVEKMVIGTSASPIGRHTRRMLEQASVKKPGFGEQVLAGVVSEENNVRLAKTKVELGQADSAVVYQTDALDAPKIRTITIPYEFNDRIAYAMGTLVGGKESKWASQWQRFMALPPAQRILIEHGFEVGR